MDTTVDSIKKRAVTFTVSQKEAESIAGWLKDALSANINTPYASQLIISLRAGFVAIAENREFGGH